jgi:hypothetical protein
VDDEGRSNVEVLTDAITNERPLFGIYDGYDRKFCPVLLGTKGRGRSIKAQVLVWLFDGETSTGSVPAPGVWRCFEAGKLSDLRFIDDPWQLGDPGSKRPRCLDVVKAKAPSYALTIQEAP